MTRTRFPDPYEGMSDDELDGHFSEIITGNRQRQRSISIRFPEELLEDLERLATQLGVRYQTLIKRLLEQDVAGLHATRFRLLTESGVRRRSTTRSRLRDRPQQSARAPLPRSAPPRSERPSVRAYRCNGDGCRGTFRDPGLLLVRLSRTDFDRDEAFSLHSSPPCRYSVKRTTAIWTRLVNVVM